MLGHFTPINIEKKALSNTFRKKMPENAVLYPDIAFHESAKFSISMNRQKGIFTKWFLRVGVGMG
ncbi:MAG: hypothetical protein ACO21J_09380 [Anaerohalosphaeraceae bacterium]